MTKPTADQTAQKTALKTIVCEACGHVEDREIPCSESAIDPLASMACTACVKVGKLKIKPSDNAAPEQPTAALVPIETVKAIAQEAALATANIVAQQFAKKEADFQQLIESKEVPEEIRKELWQLKLQELKMRQQLQIADHFVKSGAFTKDVQNAGQALVKIQAGAEIGLSPAESMTGLALINGNVTPWGVTLTKQLRKHGWELSYGECNATEATVTIKKDGKEIPFTAKKAEVPNSKAMGFAAIDKLKWHAISRLCRFYVPEVLGGMQYVAEELQDMEDADESASKDAAEKEKREAQKAEAAKLLAQ